MPRFTHRLLGRPLWACLFLMMASLHLGAQTSRENRAITDFHSLDIRGGFDVILTQASSYHLEVEAPASVIDQIAIQVQDGVLVANTKGKIRGNPKLVLHISGPAFRRIEIGGAVSLTATTPLAGQYFDLAIAGAADVDLALAMEAVYLDIGGTADVKLKGKTNQATYHVAGAGEIMAAELEATEVEVSISGTGEAEVHATEHLRVYIAGIGQVRYRGRPSIERSIAGLGKLEAL